MSAPRDGDFELVTLRNGARAVRHVGHGEIMHPSVGPWEEARQLYVEQSRLAERLGRTDGSPLVLFDVGLGAAANAVAALECAAAIQAPRRALEIVSFEVDLAPLRLALADPAGFPFVARWAHAASALVERGEFAGEGLRWRLLAGDFRSQLRAAGARAEVVFFDPFSPAQDPMLWSPSTFAELRACCREAGAWLGTYSAATPTRASLLLGGFFVGQGMAIGGKAETTVAATSLESLEKPLDARWLARWSRSSARAPHGEALDDETERRLREHPQFAPSVLTE